MALGIGGHRGLIDQLAALGDLPGHLRCGEGDGQFVIRPVRALPAPPAVAGGGVAEVVVGLDEPALAPDPGQVDDILRVHIHLPVGVAPALPVDELGLDAFPMALPDVIAVEDQVAVAGGAVAVGEEQVSIGETAELRVGHVALQLGIDHLVNHFEISAVGGPAPGVAQGDAVLGPADVQVARAVEPEADGVVRVGDVARQGGLLHHPAAQRRKLAPGHHHGPFRVVPGGELALRVAGDRGCAEYRRVDARRGIAIPEAELPGPGAAGGQQAHPRQEQEYSSDMHSANIRKRGLRRNAKVLFEVEIVGFEPATSCLQSMRSTS